MTETSTRDKFSTAQPQGLAALAECLRDECRSAGLSVDERTPADGDAFAHWYRDLVAAMEVAVASRDGHQPMTPRDVAMLCRCLLSAATLDEAIRLAADFCAMLHPRGGVLSLEVMDGRALFRMDSLRSRVTPLSSMVDTLGLLAYLQLFGWLIDRPLAPRQVQLACRERERVAPLLGLFDAPVLMGASCYGFEFDAALLQCGRARSAGELGRFLEAFPCRLYGHAAEPAVTDQVRSLVLGALYQRREIPGLAELAPLLGMSLSTLRRRLREEGTGFRQLKDSCLRQVATELLAQQRLSVEEVAQHLGFSESSSFRRAFQRWTGKSPRSVVGDGEAQDIRG